jgi:hypothetical protein
MRAIFSVVGLLLVVVVIAVLARNQLKSGVVPAMPGAAAGSTAAPVTPQQQVQQFQQAVQGTMQQARPMPENDK